MFISGRCLYNLEKLLMKSESCLFEISNNIQNYHLHVGQLKCFFFSCCCCSVIMLLRLLMLLLWWWCYCCCCYCCCCGGGWCWWYHGCCSGKHYHLCGHWFRQLFLLILLWVPLSFLLFLSWLLFLFFSIFHGT